jgi:RNA polymerase sigma-70 factor, ECF subfamily
VTFRPTVVPTRVSDRTNGIMTAVKDIPPPSDHALVIACAEGERHALGELFDRYNTVVFRFFSRMLGAGSPDLDELVNETFLNVHRAARRFRGHASVKTWITAIAANVARHHIRSESRRRAFMRILQGHLTERGVDESRSAEHRDLVRHLGKLLTALPYDLRVAFVMCDLEEIPGADAARVLGVPEGTLWRRLHQARKSLRASLQGADSEGLA